MQIVSFEVNDAIGTCAATGMAKKNCIKTNKYREFLPITTR